MRASSESCKSSRNKSYLLLVLLCVSHCIPRANAQIQRLYGHLHERRLPGEPERVEVIVSLKEHCLLSDVTPHLDFYGALLNVLLHRSHALAISIPPANIPLLQANECVVMIEEDAVVHSLTTGRETIPWGLPLVRADSVPVNRNVPCFKVCVIDSGLFVNHPDIVSHQFMKRNLLRMKNFNARANAQSVLSRTSLTAMDKPTSRVANSTCHGAKPGIVRLQETCTAPTWQVSLWPNRETTSV